MKTTARLLQVFLFTASIVLLSACKQESAPVAESAVEPAAPNPAVAAAHSVNTLADHYYAVTLKETPEVAYFSGIELPRHDGMEDNSPAARKALQSLEDEMLKELESIDVSTLKGLVSQENRFSGSPELICQLARAADQLDRN